VDHPEKFPRAKFIQTVNAPRSGWLSEVNARAVGEASVRLGAGRAKKGDPVDHAVGILVHHKVGDRLDEGEPLFTVHANGSSVGAEVRDAVAAAHVIVGQSVAALPLFYE
jgi:pyrimidine-nucleoside phosphorylase